MSNNLHYDADVKSRKETNIEATRAALLAAARKHFARVGFARAQTGKIAADARVTTGALYHHFGSKKQLFQAVAEEIEVEILAESSAIQGTQEGDPWTRFKTAFERLIDVCATPDIQRITFIEAPQVIGPEAWREIELRYAYGALHKRLPLMIEAGLIKPYPIDLIARMLLALLHETSAEVARSKHDPATRKQVSDFAASVLAALAVKP